MSHSNIQQWGICARTRSQNRQSETNNRVGRERGEGSDWQKGAKWGKKRGLCYNIKSSVHIKKKHWLWSLETHNEMECSCVNECVCVCVSMCVFNQYVSFSVSINCIFDDTPTPTPFYCVQSWSLFPKSLHNSDSITQDYAHTRTHTRTRRRRPRGYIISTLSLFFLWFPEQRPCCFVLSGVILTADIWCMKAALVCALSVFYFSVQPVLECCK